MWRHHLWLSARRDGNVESTWPTDPWRQVRGAPHWVGQMRRACRSAGETFRPQSGLHLVCSLNVAEAIYTYEEDSCGPSDSLRFCSLRLWCLIQGD